MPFRFFPVFAFFCWLSTPVSAQNYIGFKAGINQSKSTLVFNIDPRNASKRGDLTGMYFSIPLEIAVNDMLSVQPELVLASEGSLLTVFSTEENRVYTNALFYIKMPLLAKINLLEEAQYKFGVLLGVVPAYAVGISSYYYPFDHVRQSVDVPIDFESVSLNRWDFSVTLGLGVEKTIAKGLKIVLEGKYGLGLIDIETQLNQTTTIESFNFSLGLLTPLFRKSEEVIF